MYQLWEAAIICVLIVLYLLQEVEREVDLINQ